MMKPHIYCETKPNGYALDIDDKHYFYTSLRRLLVGAAWHLVHDFPEYTHIDDIIEVMTKNKKVKEIKCVKEKINTVKLNAITLGNNNKAHIAKITELTKEIRQLKKDNKKLSDKLEMFSLRANKKLS